MEDASVAGPLGVARPPGPLSGAGVGVIYPPADIRGVVDKTAAFVAKNGVDFEQRVLREQSGIKFAFLLSNNPYRPYYDMKVQEITSGASSSGPKVPQAILDMKKRQEEKKQQSEQLLMLTQHERPKEDEIESPPADQFILNHPVMSASDADILKLTAQFVARNGQKFLGGLLQRERNNLQFEFLHPSHHLFKYFNALVESYTKSLQPSEEATSRLEEDADHKNLMRIIQRFYRRHQWDDKVEKEREEKERILEAERIQMQNIDWHDFVIVECIDFLEEEDLNNLPPPLDFTTLGQEAPPAPTPQPADAVTATPEAVSGEEADGFGAGAAAAELSTPPPPPSEQPIGPAFFGPSVGAAKQDAQEPLGTAAAAPQVPSPALSATAPGDDSRLPLTNEPLIIVQDYRRPQKKRRVGTTADADKMQKCPITGQLVPVSEMSKHLRVLLLDPQWKEQKDKLLDRAKKESALAPEFDVESNLANFAVRRPDLFGSVEDQIHEHVAEP